MMKKWLALLLAAVMVLSLAACTNTGSDATTGGDETEAATEATEATKKETEATPAPDDISAEEVDSDEYVGKDTNFTYMVANGVSTNFVDHYQDLPSMQYALRKEWDPDGTGNGRKITMDVWTPPAGGEQDYATRLISTGEYPDVMNIQIASMSAGEMYEDGMTLDITDYVMQYMPNYRSFFERHPEYAGRETMLVDGQRRYLCLYHLDEVMPDAWGGMMYRRDWIVKYGTNPETGEAFTSSIDENGTYTDDVVFPSGEIYPKYISDWEWMLDIFTKALEGEGIEDGYAYQLAASGENGVYGDMESGFGSTGYYYIDPEKESVVYGAVEDGFRTYLECMNAWYQKGWINQDFYERAGEMFFMIDMGSVYSGKVGAWYGLQSNLGLGLRNPDIPWTADAVVFAAPTAINDVYGDASCQNITPFMYYTTGQFGAQLVITEKAADKDLPALFSFLDYFYEYNEDPTVEQGSYIKTYGFSKEQLESIKDELPDAYALYEKWNCLDGAYEINDEGKVVKNSSYNPVDEQDMAGSIALIRFNGLYNEEDLDRGFPEWYEEVYSLWHMYDVSAATIGGEITAQLTPEQTAHQSEVYTNVSTFTNQAVPEFITGERDIADDEAWDEFCQDLLDMDVMSYVDALNEVLGY